MREKIKENKFLQITNKILKFISWIILIILLIIAGFLIYYVLMAKKAEKEGYDYKPPMALYTIISPSMVPQINVYDVVFNTKVDDVNELEKGDIITFVSSDSYMKGMIITHRIVDKYVTNEGIQFKTKGDANLEADDALVYDENIIGKVLFKIPQLGRLQFFLSSKSGWFIVILIPALLIISYDIFKLFKLLILKKQIKDEEENLQNNSSMTEEDGEKILNLSNTNINTEKTLDNEKTITNTSEKIIEVETPVPNEGINTTANEVPEQEETIKEKPKENFDNKLEKTEEEKNDELNKLIDQLLESKRNNSKKE